jgi:hypothetical protein
VEKTAFSRPQVGYVSYPDGEFHPITNDAHGYFALQLSADGKSVVAIQGQESDSIVMLPSTGIGTPTSVAGIPNEVQIRGLDWDGKGNLIVAFPTSIVRIPPDGAKVTTLTNDPGAAIGRASFCGQEGPIFVAWFFKEGHASRNIWRLNADGTHPKQLTSGQDDRLPLCRRIGNGCITGTSMYLRSSAFPSMVELPR